MNNSKFDGLIPKKSKGQKSNLSKVLVANQPQPPAIRRGRPAGKRTNPEFVQVTAWIRKDTHLQTKIQLLTGGNGQQFSELIESLLLDWIRARSRK